jgi:hypothetical protein
MPMLPVKRQVRSKEQFAPGLCFVIGQTASSIQRTVCTLLMFCYRSNGKFDPKNSLYLPTCLCFRSSSKFDPKNSLYPSLVCTSWSSSRFDPKNSLYPALVCISRSSGKFDPKNNLYLSFVPWFGYSVNVYLDPQ